MEVAKREEAALNPDVFSASWRLKLYPFISIPFKSTFFKKFRLSHKHVSYTLVYNYTSPRSISMKKFRQHVPPARSFPWKKPAAEMLVASSCLASWKQAKEPCLTAFVKLAQRLDTAQWQ
jgi:hypothetical protein